MTLSSPQGLSRKKEAASLFSKAEKTLLKDLVAEAIRKNVQLLLVASKQHSRKVLFEHDSLSHAESQAPLSITLKLRKDGKEAILRTNALERGLVAKALEISRTLPTVEGGPMPAPAPCLSVTPNPALLALSSDELRNDALVLMSSIMSKGIIASSGAAAAAEEDRVVASTSGVWHEDHVVQYVAWASAVSKSKASTYSDSRSAFTRFAPKRLGKLIADKVTLFEKPVSLSTIEGFANLPVVFTPSTFSQLLDHAFLDNLNAQNVDKKKSIFIDALGKRLVGSITLVDDGRKRGGVNTYGCDEEGTPRRRTPLIERGTVKAFITDALQAHKHGFARTGNATLFGPDFTNVVVASFGKLPSRAIVVDNVIGAHTANSLTTDFSVKVENGFAKLGKKVIPLAPFMASGKMLDVLRAATAIGKDIEERDGVYTGSLASKCSLVP